MEKFLLSLLCLLTVAFAGKAEKKTYSYTFSSTTFTASGQEKTLKGDQNAEEVNWKLTTDTGYCQTESANGLHLGSGSKTLSSINLSTTFFNDYIVKSVKVNVKEANGNGVLTILVGDEEFLSGSANQVSLTKDYADYTFTGSLSGEIQINIKRSTSAKKAVYIKSIEVLYEEKNVDPTKQDAEVSFGEGSKKVFDLYDTTIDSFKAPVLTVTEGISVSFESSDTNVATVSETGEVTLTGELGSTRITASFAGDYTYNAASDYYTITVSKAFANVKDVLACTDGTQGLVEFPLTVAYAHGKNVFAFDAAGDFIQVYGENSYNANDVIPAGWKAKYTLYSKFTPELEPVDALPAAVETAEFTAKVVDAKDVTAELVNSVLKLNNVTFDAETPADVNNFTGVSNEVEFTFRNNYKVESQAAGTYNVTFVVNLYVARNATEAVLQLYPIAFEAVEAEKPEMPELEGDFTLTDGELKVDNVTSVRIKFNRKNANHEIYYMLTEATAESENGQNSDPESVNGGSLPTPLATRAAAEHDHAGYTKLEGDELEVKNTHSQLAYFVCDPETAAHSDIKTLALAIGNTAVAEVEMAEGEAKYFDLQGREVKGVPESGIYVRVKNGKSTKVLIK